MKMDKKQSGKLGGKQISLRKRMACEKSLVKARASRARMMPIRKLEGKIAMNRLERSSLDDTRLDNNIKHELDTEFLDLLLKYSNALYGEKL